MFRGAQQKILPNTAVPKMGHKAKPWEPGARRQKWAQTCQAAERALILHRCQGQPPLPAQLGTSLLVFCLFRNL